MATAQQMQVEMMHRLASFVTRVDHHAIAFVELLTTGEISSSCHQMPEERLMFRQRLRLRGNVCLGNEKKVRRSLRIDVGECYAEFVFVDPIRWDLTSEDLAEQTLGMKFGRRTRRFHTTFYFAKYFGC